MAISYQIVGPAHSTHLIHINSVCMDGLGNQLPEAGACARRLNRMRKGDDGTIYIEVYLCDKKCTVQ